MVFGQLVMPAVPQHSTAQPCHAMPWFHVPCHILACRAMLYCGPTGTLATKISEFWTCPNPCDKDFRILDLLEPLRQRFQNFGPTGTLASKISRFPNHSGNTFHLRYLSFMLLATSAAHTLGHELFVLYLNPRPLYNGLVDTNYGFQ